MRLIKNNVERVADGAQAEKLITLGFKEWKPNESVSSDSAPEPEQKPVKEMTTAELKALAKERGVEGAASLTKEELQEVLKDVM